MQNQDGEKNQKADILVYPYPQKIAGKGPRFNWQPDERVFTLSFNTFENNKSQATEIYIPPRSWLQGWTLTNQGVEISQSFEPVLNILSIKAQQPGEVKIMIQADKNLTVN
jgi:hypothetical protein